MIRLLLILTSFYLVSCKLDGTNTGNPDMYSSPAIENQGAINLGYQICSKISTCYVGASIDNCVIQISTLSNYTSELGTTASTYSTLNDLRNAEISNLVSPNQTNFVNCKQAIIDLSCSDALVQSGYSASDASNYSATNILFRSSGSCAQIY